MAHYAILEVLLNLKGKKAEQENFTNYLYLSKDWAKSIALIFSLDIAAILNLYTSKQRHNI